MPILRPILLAGALLLGAARANAQQSPPVSLDSLTTMVRALQARLDSVEAAARLSPATAPARAQGTYMNVSFVGLTSFGSSSARDLDRLEVGDHDPRVRGFTIPNAELALDGAVDPYFKGFANIVHKLDPNGETIVELEEMYALTTSLPHNLQLKVGQFFAEFGRQNPQHPHSWAFADDPLVLGRLLGGEGLRSQGARLSWLLPTPIFAEASLAVMNSAGETAAAFRSEESSDIHGGRTIEREVRGARDLLYVPRVSTSFDLTDRQTIVLGASGALGPNNSGADAETRIIGADVYWKWKSSTARAGFPFVAVQAEVLSRRYEAAARLASVGIAPLPAATLKDVGDYVQLQWGIRPMLIAAIRTETVRNDDPAGVGFISEARGDRSRLSTNLSWFPTEFSKFRVQYNHDHRIGIGNDSSIWFQLEFLLGSHAAHKF